MEKVLREKKNSKRIFVVPVGPTFFGMKTGTLLNSASCFEALKTLK
jgi:hypothetical protein